MQKSERMFCITSKAIDFSRPFEGVSRPTLSNYVVEPEGNDPISRATRAFGCVSLQFLVQNQKKLPVELCVLESEPVPVMEFPEPLNWDTPELRRYWSDKCTVCQKFECKLHETV